MSGHALPPFASVLKSREVEDPVNLWFNRPMAYGFVALVFRTPVTPNQVTLLATAVGIAAAACIAQGSPERMLWGGILLWSSAILDGADGILARAKQMQSDLGRALDGSADLVVALAVLVGAGYHLWDKHHSIEQMAMLPVITVSSVFHIYLYDYYKESYMAFTKTEWNGRFESRADAVNKLQALRDAQAGWVQRVAGKLYVDLMTNQYFAVKASNPAGLRENIQFPAGQHTAEIYRRYNRVPMRLWTWISLAPHTYLVAISAMFDRFDIYLWFRVIAINLLFFAALRQQRKASEATLAELLPVGAQL
ncbi:MAG TPA: CDP-alcohol phosphatidyltransferase family protein [Polyangiaceae bacterium]|nr:CDP-alcohol phosphatidyltransferase family protein [Polyangiaceae bacterium]